MADNDSVYTLVTKLCESQLRAKQRYVNNEALKKLRSKAFEILLFKRKLIPDQYWLENCNDYECQFLAWQYILKNTFKEKKMAEEIDNCLQKIIKSNYDPYTMKSIFHFLLKLKQPPKSNQQDTLEITSLYPKTKTKSNFHLQDQMSTFIKPLSSKSFHLLSSHSEYFSPDLDKLSEIRIPSRLSKSANTSSACTTIPEETDDDNIYQSALEVKPKVSFWEIESRTHFTKRRTWETLGNSTPKPEKPSISEANVELYGVIEKIRVLKERQLDLDIDDYKPQKPIKVLSKEEYMKDLKSLVVGIESNTFKAHNDSFILNEDILFENVAFAVFKQYAMLMMNVGICYKALSAMVSIIDDNIVDQHGFVYFEFCNAVKRYLTFFAAAALNMHISKGLIQFHAHIRKLSLHLFAVASICKVGTFKDNNGLNNTQDGVQVLNVLYKMVFTQANRQVMLVLHSLLYPCFQIYFIKYLNPWLFEGELNDPFQEFFIRQNKKYFLSRGRTCWTRTFSVCNEAIPNFCREYAYIILECGRITSLLKLIVPQAKIFQCYKTRKNIEETHLIQCCISEKQMQTMKKNVKCYELDVITENGAPFSLKKMMEMKRDEKLVYNRFLAVRKASSVKSIEIKKLEKSSCNLLKTNEMSNKPHSNEEFAIEEKESKILEKEAKNIITYYENLAETANKLEKVISKHNKPLKNTHLDDSQSSTTSQISSTSKNSNSSSKQTKIPRRIKSQSSVKTKTKNRKLGNSMDKESKSSKKMTIAQQNKLKVQLTEYCNALDPVYSLTPSYTSSIESNDIAKVPEAMDDNVETSSNSLKNYIKQPNFTLDKFKSNEIVNFQQEQQQNIPLRVRFEETPNIQFHFMNNYISQSILFPIRVQHSLAKAELLKHFIVDRQYITHLENMRSFYFLLDCGFARNLTHALFERIINTNVSEVLFDQKILNSIMCHARCACVQRLSYKQRVYLSFIPMEKLPQLSDVHILDCVSMTYEAKWPLNILMPTKVTDKYDEVFQFLIKVHRGEWILRQVFMNLKLLKHQYGHRFVLMQLSPQYQKLQLMRHVMTHFMQTFQNYVVGEVLQISWATFQQVLTDIDDFDALYQAHSIYMKQIHFLCFLHQKTSPVRDIIMNIFGIFLKFNDYLRSREWWLDEDEFTHPNFSKMECIYINFLALAKYFVKICRKIARAAYQPQFTQLVDTLDRNEFYSTHSTF